MSGENELITRFARNLISYLRANPNVDLESIDHATPEMPFDLGVARDNIKIHNRSGDRIFITDLSGVAYIRTRLRGAKYKLKVGNISLPFKNLFLTNTAQAGKSLSLIVGYGAYVDFFTNSRISKLLKIDESEINPACEEKQDSLIEKLDLKQSQLLTALTDTKIKEETDKVLSTGQEYECIAVTGLYLINQFFVRSPSTDFSIILSINGVDIFDRTYTELSNFTYLIGDLVAFAEVDNEGVLTGKYVIILKNINSDSHISIRIKNNSGGNISFDKILCKYIKT